MAKPPWLTLGLLGILLVLGGIFSIMAVSNQSDSEVVIEKIGEAEGRLMVDISGAVEKPGVYELKPDARVNEVLIMAGGLGKEADRDWVSQNLNLAAKVVDGQKIYIPNINESNKETPRSGLQGVSLKELINVNTASMSELDTLWGVGEVTAKKIIDNRPYGSVEELLTKKVLKSNVYEAVKDKVAVY
ncbi:MAG: helix-hairpin-helix domain-containing protein [Candidatus Beckwithbacteria bacterium]